MTLPMWLTWNLQMPRSKKISILCLFATGVICILFACLRVTQVAINASKPEATGQPLDPTWLAIWGMVECSIGKPESITSLIQPLNPRSCHHRLLPRIRRPRQRFPLEDLLRLARLPKARRQQRGQIQREQIGTCNNWK
jgi:hypothetical protein